MRGCLPVLTVVVAVVLFLVVVGAALLSQPPSLGAAITPVAVSSAAGESFDRKLATVQSAAAPVTVEFTDEEATSKLVEALAAEPGAPRIDGAQVAFRDGKVYLSGTSRDAPIPVRVVVAGRIEAREGRLVSTVEQVDTGPVPLPAPLRARITDAASNLDALNEGVPIYITDVRVLDGRLVLTGRPK